MMPVLCKVCDKVFSTRSNLNKHSVNVHNKKLERVAYHKSVWSNKCLEGQCAKSFCKNDDLIEHLTSVHNLVFDTETLCFRNMQEFNDWKLSIEQNDVHSYFVSSRRHVYGKVVTYYDCNRSGKSSQLQNRKRSMKSQGSCKLNRSCTSKIKLLKMGDELSVVWVKTHYGHGRDLKHIPISKTDRLAIASKLISGVSPAEIVDSQRNKTGTPLKRIDLLSKRDVSNIRKSTHMLIPDEINDKDHATSIDVWVEQCKDSAENPVLFYKNQGFEAENLEKEDFCLIVMNNFQEDMLKKFGTNVILIDGTHGLNKYNFELTILMVIDDFNEDFPVAFLLSNRKDHFVYRLFFDTIKCKVGIIQANTFMSDVTNAFYNAWSAVMKSVGCHFWCSWHVDRAWQTNLTKIKCKDNRSLVYKTLKVLQREKDQTKFHDGLIEAHQLMLADRDLEAFGLYFSKHYYHTYTNWAYSYRKKCGINRNTRLESLHRALKHIYLEGNTVECLNRGFHSLLKYVRDKSIMHIIKTANGNYSSHVSNIFEKHRTALESQFKIEQVKNGKWRIENDEGVYIIETNVGNNCCDLICSSCTICVHKYMCTCPNYFINSTICTHIHFLILNGESHGVPINSALMLARISETFSLLQSTNFDQMPQDAVAEICRNLSNINNTLRLHNTDVQQ